MDVALKRQKTKKKKNCSNSEYNNKKSNPILKPHFIYSDVKFFYCYFLNTFFFLLYTIGTQLHIEVYILFSPIIMLHHKWIDIVLSAKQQDLIANPFQKQ